MRTVVRTHMREYRHDHEVLEALRQGIAVLPKSTPLKATALVAPRAALGENDSAGEVRQASGHPCVRAP